MEKREIPKEKSSKMSKKQFGQLFNLYYPRLKRYAFCLLKDDAEAEDLVQDVFVQFWQSTPGFQDENKVGSYLYTSVKNRCLNLLKHKFIEKKYVLNALENEAEELYHISLAETDEFISMEKRLKNELEKIISEMPEKCRTAFRLRWFEGKKIREIAEIMEISTTMVDKHLAKGLETARQKLPPDFNALYP